MLEFKKGFSKKEETIIVSNYIPMTESEKIERIRNQMTGVYQKTKPISNTPIIENKKMHKDRIDALKNIKKD